MKDITVDVGAVSKEEAVEKFGIRIGEPVVPDVTFTYSETTDLMVGKSFDCRLGCAAILKTMHTLAGQDLNVDIVGACAAQEEVGVRGATVTAQVIKPDIAIVFEGCPADDTCVEQYMVQTAIKRGPMLRHIDSRMITNPRYQRYALDLAEKLGIPVQDADGQKMSKSKGNAVDPFDALQKHGADAIRWYFYENSAPWVPNRFKDEWVSEGQRKFMGTFWNTYAFFVLYANIDNFDATKYQLEYDKLSVMDKWLLSKLNSLVKFVDTNLENYKITETARALEDFTDELSNWYVRRSRERFWAKGMEQDKINAYMTLYTTLVTLAKISAPMVPFMTESIYRNLVCSIDKNAPISIHLCDFPKVNEQFIDKKLEETMDDVLDAVVIGRACRNSTNIKNRQPIGKMFIKADWKLDEFYTAIIADELNVKEVEYTDDVRAFTSYSFKPQMKTLGPKYGKLLNAIRTALTEVDGNATMDKLNESGSFELNVEGQTIELSKDDVLIEMTQKEGFVASFSTASVTFSPLISHSFSNPAVFPVIISCARTTVLT